MKAKENNLIPTWGQNLVYANSKVSYPHQYAQKKQVGHGQNDQNAGQLSNLLILAVQKDHKPN